MLNESLQAALQHLLDDCYDTLVQEWQEHDPLELIDQAERIAAVKLVHAGLVGAIGDKNAMVLFTLENPLIAVSEKWLEENELYMAHDDGLVNCVQSLREEQRAAGAPAERDVSLALAQQALRQRAAENYDGFVAEWQKLTPSELIEKSAEIASIQEARAALKAGGLDRAACEMLLCFQNPLDSIGGLVRTFLDEKLSSAKGEQTRAQAAIWLISRFQGHDGHGVNGNPRAKLNQRVEDGYHALLEGWQKLSPTKLIENAAEIAAIREVRAELEQADLDPGVCRALLRYPNPLDTVGGISHVFMDEAFISPNRETRFQRAVQYLFDNQEAELSYEQRDPAGPTIGEVTL